MLWVAGGNPRPPALSDNPGTVLIIRWLATLHNNGTILNLLYYKISV